MKLNEGLVEAAAQAAVDYSNPLPLWKDMSDSTRERAIGQVRVAIEHYLTNRSLPERMREAADTLREIARKVGSSEPDRSFEMTPWTLEHDADLWEAEDRAAVERDKLAQELAAEVFMFTAEDKFEYVLQAAQKLIADGWTKGGER
ncbi:hypothetical protein ACAG26_24200 [Mycobacterium sp. pUA109]|uniref:hypothetical protein n=1 Tax=Mycobacterium sp. pUA109 TaxID=3238982 RepID=UPI00351B21B6